MIEVEVKARINGFDDMREKLDSLGAVYTKTESQKDLYFGSPVVDFALSDEALRVRVTDDDIFITYKGPKIDSKSKTRREIEFSIEDADKASDMFEAVGFKKVRTVSKIRHYYSYKNFEISLDDVEGLEPYMEIEAVLEDGEDYSKAQESIFDLFSKLGVHDSFERTSYMELLENL